MESIKKTQCIFFFKCDVCGVTFKKEIILKKHYNTKPEEQNCKVFSKTIEILMEVLQHVANEHVERDISEHSESNAGSTIDKAIKRLTTMGLVVPTD